MISYTRARNDWLVLRTDMGGALSAFAAVCTWIVRKPSQYLNGSPVLEAILGRWVAFKQARV